MEGEDPGRRELLTYDGDDDYDFGDPYVTPPGLRFDPSDGSLLAFYLRGKSVGKLPPTCDFIPTLDLYTSGDPCGLEPWSIHPALMAVGPPVPTRWSPFLPRDRTEWFYFFTHTTRRGPGSRRTVGSGTWHANGKDTKIRGARGQLLGHKRTFAFKITGAEPVLSTNWVMHEFTLQPDEPLGVGSGDGELVLCRIRCTKRHGGHEEEATRCWSKKRRVGGGPETAADHGERRRCSVGSDHYCSDMNTSPTPGVLGQPRELNVVDSECRFDDDASTGGGVPPHTNIDVDEHPRGLSTTSTTEDLTVVMTELGEEEEAAFWDQLLPQDEDIQWQEQSFSSVEGRGGVPCTQTRGEYGSSTDRPDVNRSSPTPMVPLTPRAVPAPTDDNVGGLVGERRSSSGNDDSSTFPSMLKDPLPVEMTEPALDSEVSYRLVFDQLYEEDLWQQQSFFWMDPGGVPCI